MTRVWIPVTRSLLTGDSPCSVSSKDEQAGSAAQESNIVAAECSAAIRSTAGHERRLPGFALSASAARWLNSRMSRSRRSAAERASSNSSNPVHWEASRPRRRNSPARAQIRTFQLLRDRKTWRPFSAISSTINGHAAVRVPPGRKASPESWLGCRLKYRLAAVARRPTASLRCDRGESAEVALSQPTLSDGCGVAPVHGLSRR